MKRGIFFPGFHGKPNDITRRLEGTILLGFNTIKAMRSEDVKRGIIYGFLWPF